MKQWLRKWFVVTVEPIRPTLEVEYENGIFLTRSGGKVDVCEWCGCTHTFFCPRIKSVTFFPHRAENGPAIEHIEFWEEESKELWGTVVELVPVAEAEVSA